MGPHGGGRERGVAGGSPGCGKKGAAGGTLISPFVGRSDDGNPKERGTPDIPADGDQGVASVTRIYNYLQKFDDATRLTGASFRKVVRLFAPRVGTCGPSAPAGDWR
jgi:transaldolase